jgi:DNA-directed RNA polymerase subunit RPC12/RpoP
MDAQKYRCHRCGEVFEIEGLSQALELACPRCYREDLSEHNIYRLEIGSPPWEYQCQQCCVRFQVTAPRGPDKAKAIRCPACRSKDVKWPIFSSAACATGG